MGARGRGARPAKKLEKKRRLPWKKRGLNRVERVIAFCEWLPITKGRLAGNRMKLLPSQVEFIEAVYGSDPEVRIAIFSEPRGNGKTGLLSALALCHLLGPEAEERGEIYSAAIDRQQAGILFAEMEAIIVRVPEFHHRVNIQRFHKRIEVLGEDGFGSTYEAISSDARRAHGLAPSLWIYDEMAQIKSREMLDNLMTGMGKRHRSLGMIISTQAPDDQHPLSQMIDDGLGDDDPTTYVKLIAADLDANPFDVDVIRSVNPAADHFLDFEELVKQAEQAERMPSFEMRFRNLRLNQRVQAETVFVSQAVWKQNAGKPVKDFGKNPVYGGLDLSSTTDLTSLTLACEIEKMWHIHQWFWLPEEGLTDKSHIDRVPYLEWRDMGYLSTTPGTAVEYDYVASELRSIFERYNIAKIAFDRWNWKHFEPCLKRAGFPEWELEQKFESFGQGYASMSPALRETEALLLARRIRHGSNPILNYCALNAVAQMDPAGNRKLAKNRSTGRIDGMITLAMAVAVGTDASPAQFVSGRLKAV